MKRNPIFQHISAVLFTGLLFVLAGCGEPDPQEVTISYENGEPSERFFLDADSLRHGNYTSYHTNGKPFEAFVYKRGLLWEVTRIQDSSGNELAAATLQNGTGVLPRYSTTGDLFARLPYKDGLPEGDMELMSPGGERVSMRITFLGGLPASADHPRYKAQMAAAVLDTSGNEALPQSDKEVEGLSMQFPNKIMRLLANSDYENLYALTDQEYQKEYSQEAFVKYISFLKQIMGDIKAYTVDGYESEDIPGKGTFVQMVYHTKHTKGNGNAILLLKMKDGAVSHLSNIALQTERGQPLNHLRKIGDPLMAQMQAKETEGIYENGGKQLKEIPKAQFLQGLKRFYELGEITEYSLFHNEVFMVDDLIGVGLIYKIKLGGQEAALQLLFSHEDGEYKFVGINA